MSTVISVEHLSKRYRLGVIGEGSLRQDFSRWWARMLNQPDPNAKIGEEHHARLIGQEFWALQDVSFKVEQGDILGVIGRNGAGKSTLLKILSRVTGPTSGQVKIKGRIASLLEVGTGFHPELSGRENIFLNGTILGMTRAEIRKKFDEIVAFAEIEDFIDTPVKRYSSGMYVRLAFAVAAHLEPEILIVDEVLAVGDMAFQKKCLGKMQDVSQQEGRTVLFVSHNIDAVRTLCTRVLELAKGRVEAVGETEPVLHSYIQRTAGNATGSLRKSINISSALALTKLEAVPAEIIAGQSIRFTINLTASKPSVIRKAALLIYRQGGPRAAMLDLLPDGAEHRLKEGDRLEWTVETKNVQLVDGEYSVGLYLFANDAHSDTFDAVVFGVIKAGSPAAFASVHRGIIELDYGVSRQTTTAA